MISYVCTIIVSFTCFLLVIGTPLSVVASRLPGDAQSNMTYRLSMAVGACGANLSSCACFDQLAEQYNKVRAMPDRVARNWWISLTYMDIGQAFQRMLHTAPTAESPNPSIVWPTMAMWASNVVGFGIRGQMIDEVMAYWKRSAPSWMQELLTIIPEIADLVFQQYLAATSIGLGNGNLIVFEEIGGSYSKYGQAFCSDTKYNTTKLEAFLADVCVNASCPLARALRATYEAQFRAGADLALKDQFLFVQSMLAGLQEQTRLGPFINASLPGYDFCWNTSSLAGKVGGDKFRELHRRNAIRVSGEGDVTCLAPQLLNELATDFLIHLVIGSHRMPVTTNVPSGLHDHGRSNFSLSLRNLSLPEARSIWVEMQYNHTNDTTVLDFTAATDWNHLDQRMRFISAAFRVFQDSPEINCFPFSAEQEALIRANETQKLDPSSWETLCVSDCCAKNGQWRG